MESLENQDIQESIQDATPLEKVKKTPKPRSEKQMEHFKNLQQKRKEAIEKKKLEKKIEASKLLLEHNATPATPAQPKQKKVTQPSPPQSEDEEESDSSVEKIVVNVKKKPKKKKAKEIIIYNEDSDTEEEEEEEEYHQPKRALKTQQNKKSKTKVYQQERERPLTETGGLQPQIFKSQSNNYFVD